MAVGLKDNTGASRNDAWFLGVLNRPTQAGLSPSTLVEAAIEGRAEQYLAYARSVFTSVEGPMPLVVLPIHGHDFYRHSPADQEKVWDLYERVLRLALALGFQPITMQDVYAMVRNGPAPALTRNDLLAAAQNLVETMEATGYPPEYVSPHPLPPNPPSPSPNFGRGGRGSGGMGERASARLMPSRAWLVPWWLTARWATCLLWWRSTTCWVPRPISPAA